MSVNTISSYLKCIKIYLSVLNNTAQEIGLIIYQKKKKIVSVHMKTHNQCKEIKIGVYVFDRFSSFPGSVSILNGDNSIPEEIKHLI
jgi:hypothetical protein